ncbi:MAG: N-acetyltransferase [Anaerolineaceae bacterium]
MMIRIMNCAEILHLYDEQMRKGMTYPDMRKESLPNVVRFTRPAPGTNFILYSRLDGAHVDEAIEEQVAYFRHFNQPFTWKVYAHDEPPDLLKRLAAHGFDPQDEAALMALDLQAIPADLTAPRRSMDLRRITRSEDLGDLVSLMEMVWGGNFDWMYERIGAHLEIPDFLSLYMIYEADQPVCAGWTYFHPGTVFADLWGGSTLPMYRKRGFYTALLAARAQEAAQRGYRYLTIDAGEMSAPIVARHGFQRLTTVHDCLWVGDRL